MSVKATTEQPCCTITCGQQVGSWRDIMMGMVELGGAAISFGSFYFAQNNVLGGGSAAVTVLTGLVHWRWRNDAHGKPTEGGKKELKEVSIHGANQEEKEKRPEDSVHHQMPRSSSNTDELVTGLGQLALLKMRFTETSKELERKIQKFEESKKKLSEENKDLIDSNKELKVQLRVLSTVIGDFRDIHGHYKKHTGELEDLFNLESSRIHAGDKTDRTDPPEEDMVRILPRKHAHAEKHDHPKKVVVEEVEDETESV